MVQIDTASSVNTRTSIQNTQCLPLNDSMGFHPMKPLHLAYRSPPRIFFRGTEANSVSTPLLDLHSVDPPVTGSLGNIASNPYLPFLTCLSRTPWRRCSQFLQESRRLWQTDSSTHCSTNLLSVHHVCKPLLQELGLWPWTRFTRSLKLCGGR